MSVGIERELVTPHHRADNESDRAGQRAWLNKTVGLPARCEDCDDPADVELLTQRELTVVLCLYCAIRRMKQSPGGTGRRLRRYARARETR